MLLRIEQSTGVIHVTHVSTSHSSAMADVATEDYSQKMAVRKYFLLYVEIGDSRKHKTQNSA